MHVEKFEKFYTRKVVICGTKSIDNVLNIEYKIACLEVKKNHSESVKNIEGLSNIVVS